MGSSASPLRVTALSHRSDVCWTPPGAFSDFAARVQLMKDAGVSGEELSSPLNFWVFFAAMHPLIGGVGVGIGELMWQFPGCARARAPARDATRCRAPLGRPLARAR